MPEPSNMSAQLDTELVAAARDGDAQAYEELVYRHRDKIYARAFSMVRNEEQALDLSQEAWIKAWQRLHQFHGDSSFATWITRITINLSLDFLRKAKRQRAESVEALEESSGGVERLLPVINPNPTARLERVELRAKIDQAMETLSEGHRTVLILHEFEELPYKEIAKRVGCSIGTVMSRLFYARRRMATAMKELLREEEA
ncbi:MAG: sigma-70 family RNA polymerase sigma factor [Verrucomicrobia bacterium]|nr:sigma-70 family RNA polymerase sigma factor [Verrucomicrobiota bacterium]